MCLLDETIGSYQVAGMTLNSTYSLTYSTMVLYFYRDKRGNVLDRNIEARSFNSYCRGKAIRIKYFECVPNLSYPACEERAG